MLVTGGAGFIGSNFVYYMLEKYKGYEIVCLDALTYASRLTTLDQAQKHRQFTFVKGDITDRKFVFELFAKYKFDTVVHFAAESHVDRSIMNPAIFTTTNVMGTQVLLDAALTFGVTRFHQVSTDEVYGQLPLHKPDVKFVETMPLQPSSPYAASKAAADLLVLSYTHTFQLPATITRCSNNYGPYHFPEKLIPLVITRVLNGEPIPVYGTGQQIRDWLHVSDHCRAIDLVIHQGTTGEVYNVGGNCERTNLSVIEMIVDRLNQSRQLITFTADRLGHDLRYAIDATKIATALRWQPLITFENGLQRTIDWYVQHQRWWRS